MPACHFPAGEGLKAFQGKKKQQWASYIPQEACYKMLLLECSALLFVFIYKSWKINFCIVAFDLKNAIFSFPAAAQFVPNKPLKKA